MIDINGKTDIYGLIGNPVKHTVSPLIQNTLAAKTGQNMAYVPLHVSDKRQLKSAIEGAYALNIQGLNVTVPYKSAVIPYLKHVDELARQIGAVNTLVRTDGGYIGYNTDMTGLLRDIDEIISGGINELIHEKDVIIIGAGGAGRAAAFMCAYAGAKRIWLLNRTVSKAEEAAREIEAVYKQTQIIPIGLDECERIPKGHYLALQATNIGLNSDKGQSPECVITDAEFYKKIRLGYDLIYNPPVTGFTERVVAAGGIAVNGMGMLIYQGIAAYELWRGIKVSDTLIKEIKIVTGKTEG